jgi:hypothetical protein
LAGWYGANIWRTETASDGSTLSRNGLRGIAASTEADRLGLIPALVAPLADSAVPTVAGSLGFVAYGRWKLEPLPAGWRRRSVPDIASFEEQR